MAAPAYDVQSTQTIYAFPPTPNAKQEPAPKRWPASSILLLFVLLVMLATSISQTMQIRQLASDTRTLREETATVQIERDRILADIHLRSQS